MNFGVTGAIMVLGNENDYIVEVVSMLDKMEWLFLMLVQR